ncbi:GatB/YqeY domain-containing protein [Frateuria aurantia]
MSLKSQLTEDMKTAMRSSDKHRLGVIRLILAAIKQREVDSRSELDEAEVLQTLEKMLKQRRDSVQQFDAAGRADLSAIEQAEITIISDYLPRALDESALRELIEAAVNATGANRPQDLGKIVAYVKSHAVGRADMALVAHLAKQRLQPA